MAMRKKCEENVGLAGLVRSTSFGRKRICLPEIVDFDDFISTTPIKKLCRQNSFSSSVNVKSPLEALPQDILIGSHTWSPDAMEGPKRVNIQFPTSHVGRVENGLTKIIMIRIVCGVDHDDLKRLFHVSKAIREATLVAKKWHFEYNTPRKTVGFKNATTAMENWSESYEVEAPNAPRQSKFPRSRLSRKKLADITVSLFTSDGEENWPRRELFMEMDTEM